MIVKIKYFKWSAIIISSLIFSSMTFAQKRLELGLSLGGSFYQGDILGQTASEIAPNMHLAAELQAGYFWNNHLGMRFGLGYGAMSGGDKYAEAPWRRARNLSFESNVFHGGGRIEYNITGFNPEDNQNFTIYPFIGYHHLFFEPKTEYKGKVYSLQPLGTEGQGLAKYPDKKPYKLNTGSLVYGGGVRIAMTPRISIGLEFSAFRSFTDYLDDVAGRYVPFTDILQETGNQVAAALSNREGEFIGSDQIVLRNNSELRGNLKVFDYYYQFGLTVMYNLYDPFGPKSRGAFSRKKSTKDCFKF
jgi:hypothetical protein